MQAWAKAAGYEIDDLPSAAARWMKHLLEERAAGVVRKKTGQPLVSKAPLRCFERADMGDDTTFRIVHRAQLWSGKCEAHWPMLGPSGECEEGRREAERVQQSVGSVGKVGERLGGCSTLRGVWGR